MLVLDGKWWHVIDVVAIGLGKAIVVVGEGRDNVVVVVVGVDEEVVTMWWSWLE